MNDIDDIWNWATNMSKLVGEHHRKSELTNINP
jgi:hypothetical protein